MKSKIYYFPILLLICSLTSCDKSTGFSIAKRHYRDGFHIEYLSKKPLEKKANNDITSYLNYKEENTSFETKENFLLKEPPKEILQPKKETSRINEKNKISKKLTEQLPNLILPVKSTSISKLKSTSVPKNITSSQDTGDSVVWTLISIFLVLWLISLLTGGWGLGGLIYIFLVIALILLLLKLLHAI